MFIKYQVPGVICVVVGELRLMWVCVVSGCVILSRLVLSMVHTRITPFNCQGFLETIEEIIRCYSVEKDGC